ARRLRGETERPHQGRARAHLLPPARLTTLLLRLPSPPGRGQQAWVLLRAADADALAQAVDGLHGSTLIGRSMTARAAEGRPPSVSPRDEARIAAKLVEAHGEDIDDVFDFDIHDEAALDEAVEPITDDEVSLHFAPT